jgi:NDP-sugar pyrophosphorylase family protein
MLSVLGRPMAVQNLQRLATASVTCAVVNLHYRPSVLRALLGDGGADGLPEIRYTFEDPVLGTGGGIRNAAKFLRDEGPFLVHNSDFLSDIDFGSLRDDHERGGFLATMVLAPARPGYSAVTVDAGGRIISIAGRPEVDPARAAGSFLFTGCHLLDESLLDRLPTTGPYNIIELYRELAAAGQLGAHLHHGFWWEFGSPGPFLEGQLALLDLDEAARSRVADHDPVREMGNGARVSVGPGVEMDAGVEFQGRCVLALAARIGGDSRLKDSIVLEESWIGPGCRLERAIIGPHAELPAGFEVANAIVCPDLNSGEEPGDGIERRDGLLIRPFGT